MSQAPGPRSWVRSARPIGTPLMARTPFSLPETTIVVSTEGYFDVYPAGPRSNSDRPSYRGRLAELGPGVRGGDDRLAIRPGSTALAAVVQAWSAVHGAAAVRGELGAGRDGNEVVLTP